MKKPQAVILKQALLRPLTVNGTASLDSQAGLPSPDKLSRVDYCGNMVYDRGKRRLLIGNGYVTFDLQTNAPSYHFYLRYHLGNNRVVMAGDGTVEQVTHYYPFVGAVPRPGHRRPWHAPERTSSGLRGWPAGRNGCRIAHSIQP